MELARTQKSASARWKLTWIVLAVLSLVVSLTLLARTSMHSDGGEAIASPRTRQTPVAHQSDSTGDQSPQSERTRESLGATETPPAKPELLVESQGSSLVQTPEWERRCRRMLEKALGDLGQAPTLEHANAVILPATAILIEKRGIGTVVQAERGGSRFDVEQGPNAPLSFAINGRFYTCDRLAAPLLGDVADRLSNLRPGVDPPQADWYSLVLEFGSNAMKLLAEDR